MKQDLRPDWIKACDGLKDGHLMADGRPAGRWIEAQCNSSRPLRREAKRTQAHKTVLYNMEILSLRVKVAARSAKRLAKDAVAEAQ